MTHNPILNALIVSLLALVGPAGWGRLAGQTTACPQFSNSPVNLSNDPAPSFRPRIGLSANGTLHVAYYDGQDVRHTTSTDQGQSFAPPAAIPLGPLGQPSQPDLATQGMNVHLAYRSGVSSASTVAYVWSPDCGANWSAPVALSTGTFASEPEIVARGGHVYVVYQAVPQGDSTFDAMLVSSSDGGQSWSSPVNLSQSMGVNSRTPDVSVNGTGMPGIQHVMTAWREEGPTPSVLTSGSTDSAATFAAPVAAGPLNSTAGSTGPDVATDHDTDTVIVTWSDIPGPFVQGDVFAAKSTDWGASFSVPVNISNTPSNPTRDPQAAVVGQRLWFAFEQPFGGPFEIFQICSRDLSLTNLTTPQQISDPSGGQSTAVDMDFDSDLMAIVYEDLVSTTSTAPDVVADTAPLGAQLNPVPGTGCPNAHGIVPTWAATGDFTGSFTVSVGPFAPMSAGLLGISPNPVPAPFTLPGGCIVGLDPANVVLVPISTDAQGFADFPLLGPVPPGLDVSIQAAITDFVNGLVAFSVKAVLFGL